MSKKYVDYIVEETKKILSIDSPSGYTKEVADYVMGEYRKLGYEPKLTVKGGVLVALGGKEKENAGKGKKRWRRVFWFTASGTWCI